MDYTSVIIEVPTSTVQQSVECLSKFGHSPTFESTTGLLQPPTTNLFIESVCRGDVDDELYSLEECGIPYSCHVEPNVNVPESHFHLRFSFDGTPLKSTYHGSIHFLEIYKIKEVLEGPEDDVKSRITALIEETLKPDW